MSFIRCFVLFLCNKRSASYAKGVFKIRDENISCAQTLSGSSRPEFIEIEERREPKCLPYWLEQPSYPVEEAPKDAHRKRVRVGMTSTYFGLFASLYFHHTQYLGNRQFGFEQGKSHTNAVARTQMCR